MFSKNRVLSAPVFVFFFINSLFAVTYTVSKNGSGKYTTIQAAVDKSTAGDTVKILDTATYQEQVTIDNHHNSITLISADPTSLKKPKIIWQDKVNEGPKTCSDAQIDSLITFNKNGALRLINVRNVMIDGITVDGGGVMPFGSTVPVWSDPYNGGKTLCTIPNFHGNTAIVLFSSGDIIIRNCEARNAYFGIFLYDRNDYGIFSISSAGECGSPDIIPISDFAKAGNHLIEYSRIHDNSYGIFVESAWDLGSTIRYNIIYENHHPAAELAAQVKALNSEGANQPGGAIFFRDDMLTPFSIYNNTFWHNYLIFHGGWQAGYTHLVFNNIFAKPFTYWTDVPVFSTQSYMELAPVLMNRITSCIYSCQIKPPQASDISIMIGLPHLKDLLDQPIPQGILLYAAGSFPAAANNRWLEMDTALFISVDPASPHFLEPNWNDSLVRKHIKNQGWQKSGVRNLDGPWADIGAIPSSGGNPIDIAVVRPIMPVLLDTGTSRATVNFSLTESVGKIQDPAIKFFRWIGNLEAVYNSWAGSATKAVISTDNIKDIPIPVIPVKVGANTFTVNIPVKQTTRYGFFEAIIEGTGSDGKLYTTSTGFLPYRQNNDYFEVKILKNDLSKQLDSVTTGDTLVLKVVPRNINGTVYTDSIPRVDAYLFSGFPLMKKAVNSVVPLTFPHGIQGETNTPIVFTKVPPGGFEIVSISGAGLFKIDCQSLYSNHLFVGRAFVHVSGVPAGVRFQSPQLSKDIISGKKSFDISCFNLQGRRVFYSVKESYSGPLQQKDFQRLWKNNIASGLFIVRLSTREGGATHHKYSAMFLRP